MKQEVKSVLYFLLGAGCGGGIAWYFTSKHYRKWASEQIDIVTKRVKERSSGKNVGKLGVTEESTAVVEKAYKSRVNAEKQLIESYRTTIPENRTAYSDIKVTTETPVIVQPVEDMPEEDEERAPYLISVEEYGDVEPYYEKVTLIYDIDDGLLVDADTGNMMDVIETIGYPVYEQLDKFNDGTYLYVRNDKISVDYEVEIRKYD